MGQAASWDPFRLKFWKLAHRHSSGLLFATPHALDADFNRGSDGRSIFTPDALHYGLQKSCNLGVIRRSRGDLMSVASAPWQIASTFVRNLERRRGLILNLVARDFKQRYIGSSMGWLWAAVHPMVLLASYTFVFAVVFKVKLGPEAGTSNYAIFLFAGMLPWMLFRRPCSAPRTPWWIMPT